MTARPGKRPGTNAAADAGRAVPRPGSADFAARHAADAATTPLAAGEHLDLLAAGEAIRRHVSSRPAEWRAPGAAVRCRLARHRRYHRHQPRRCPRRLPRWIAGQAGSGTTAPPAGHRSVWPRRQRTRRLPPRRDRPPPDSGRRFRLPDDPPRPAAHRRPRRRPRPPRTAEEARTPVTLWLAVADVPVLLAEVHRGRSLLALVRAEYADLLAAARATLAADRDGETDPLYYLRDELAARGQLPPKHLRPVELLAQAGGPGEPPQPSTPVRPPPPARRRTAAVRPRRPLPRPDPRSPRPLDLPLPLRTRPSPHRRRPRPYRAVLHARRPGPGPPSPS